MLAETHRDFRCKFDDGSNFGNINIDGNESFIVHSGSSSPKELCRPISQDARVIVLKCAKSDKIEFTSSIFVLDQNTGDAQYAASGLTGNTHSTFSGIKCQGLKSQSSAIKAKH